MMTKQFPGRNKVCNILGRVTGGKYFGSDNNFGDSEWAFFVWMCLSCVDECECS